MKFKKMMLDDACVLRSYFEKSTNRFCDFSVGGSVMWRNVYDTEYAILDGAMYMNFRIGDNERAFSYPIGKPLPETVGNIRAYCESTGIPMIFAALSADEKDELCSLFPQSDFLLDRDHSDYIYLGEDLAELKGKKYATQRNHINRFLSENSDWCFKEITQENLSLVKEFFERFVKENEKEGFSAQEEIKCVFDVLEKFSSYGFFGEALFVGDAIVGFFLGECVGDTFIVHIEKSDRNIQGAYQMLARREAEKYCVGNIKYVNREDDAGDEGLRRSKLAYRPAYIAEKYTVIVK